MFFDSIQRMDRQMHLVEDRMNKFGDQLIKLEADMDESNLAKLKGLKETEAKFERFLNSAPGLSEDEKNRITTKEQQIGQSLFEISQINDYVRNFDNLRHTDMDDGDLFSDFFLITVPTFISLHAFSLQN